MAQKGKVAEAVAAEAVAAEEKPTETGPVEEKPTETGPAEEKPTETGPAEAKTNDEANDQARAEKPHKEKQRFALGAKEIALDVDAEERERAHPFVSKAGVAVDVRAAGKGDMVLTFDDGFMARMDVSVFSRLFDTLPAAWWNQ